MLEPTRLTTAVQAAGVLDFEGFFHIEHERLFQALYLLTGNRHSSMTCDRGRWSHPAIGCLPASGQ
jgi:hypothetical protein